MRVWRVYDKALAAEAWTGEGARIWGGRWNPPGVSVVYTSEHPALAILEVMAGNLRHVDLRHFELASCDVPGESIVTLPPGTSELGRASAWLASGALGCLVPSAVTEGHNVLLNPASQDWKRLVFNRPTPIDARLMP